VIISLSDGMSHTRDKSEDGGTDSAGRV